MWKKAEGQKGAILEKAGMEFLSQEVAIMAEGWEGTSFAATQKCPNKMLGGNHCG